MSDTDNGRALLRSPAIVAKQRIMPISYMRPLAGGRHSDEDGFLEAISKRLGKDTTAIPLGRARAGLYLLAKFAVRPGRRKVLMSSYTIPDVVTMVTLAGAEPVFYDLEPGGTACNLESLKLLLDEETACVLVTHYHVNETNLAPIVALCRAMGAYLFDDCAIAFGGSVEGQPVGTLTDASVFSFSSFKLLNYFWGGLVTTRNPDIAAWLDEQVERWPRLSPRDYAAPFKLCLQYDVASSPLLFSHLVFPMIRRRLMRSSSTKGLEHTRIETTELNPTLTSRPALAAFAEWISKLEKADHWLAGRRKIAAIYSRSLGKHMVGAGTAVKVLEGSCFTNFPVLADKNRCGAIVRTMMLSGFDVGRSLYPNAHRHPKFAGVKGHSANTDHLAASVIYLPTHFGVSEQYAESIAVRLASELGH